jgi:RNA polymerase sigma-70 factor (ECF subfamily)
MPESNPLLSHARSQHELLAAVKERDEAAVKSIIRQHNRMLFRLARSILPSDDESEDAVQAAYVRAFTSLDGFRGEAGFGTWLARIVLNEALGRARRERPKVPIDTFETATAAEIIPFPFAATSPDPERAMAQGQMRRILEQAIDELPTPFRMVVIARLVEELSVEETAEILGLRPATVKTRLHRARALLRRALEKEIGIALRDAFPFAGARCFNMAERVLADLRLRE